MIDLPNRPPLRPGTRIEQAAPTRLADRRPLAPLDGGMASDAGAALDAALAPGLDVLSDVFRCIRLAGSMFFLVTAATPWITRVPATGTFGAAVLPGAQHLISYHVITEGACWGAIDDEPAQRLEAGDILMIPHGAPYYLCNPAATQADCSDVDAVSFFRRMVAGELPPVVTEGGGGPEKTQLICGFLGCDVRPFNPILAALPPVLYLRHATQASSRLRHLVAFALSELRDGRPGSREVLLRLSELMFIAAVTCHLESMPDTAAGWLAGLREPLVARVLSLMHAQPSRAWTLGTLAHEAGSSRSVLATRFAQVLGQPPIRYLTAWRMQLATRLLAERGSKVRDVGEAVGYDSEAAFSRAFTRIVGSNPVAWRDAARRPPRVSPPAMGS